MNLKQRAFLKEYMKTGNGTRSYLKVYGDKDRQSAAERSSKMLARMREQRGSYFESKGLDDQAIAKVLSDGLKAEKQMIYKSQVYEFPDHYARLKTVETLEKITQPEKGTTNNGSQVNIVIQNNPTKGDFSVSEVIDG